MILWYPNFTCFRQMCSLGTLFSAFLNRYQLFCTRIIPQIKFPIWLRPHSSLLKSMLARLRGYWCSMEISRLLTVSWVGPCVNLKVLICWKEEEQFDIHPPLLLHKICHDCNSITSWVPHSSEDMALGKVNKLNMVQFQASWSSWFFFPVLLRPFVPLLINTFINFTQRWESIVMS